MGKHWKPVIILLCTLRRTWGTQRVAYEQIALMGIPGICRTDIAPMQEVQFESKKRSFSELDSR
jgi:hypothetical protein